MHIQKAKGRELDIIVFLYEYRHLEYRKPPIRLGGKI